MDKNTLRNTLDQLAQQEIPDDMNLIPTVRDQLQGRHHAKRFRSLRAAAVLAAVLIFSSMSVAAAVVLYQQRNDPGLTGADEQGLFTTLDLTQTVKGVTVTLEQGYADANRVALLTEFRYDRAVAAVPDAGFSLDHRLIDRTTGAELPEIPLGGGGGGSNGDTTIIEGVGQLSFDATSITTAPETLDLRLEVTFAALPAGNPSGGGGGGGSADQPPTTVPQSSANPADAFVPFTITFDFSLPFIEEYIIPASALPPVTRNGIDMRIEQISIAPSLTRIDLCYTLPDDDGLWTPYMALNTADNTYTQELFLPLDAPVQDGEICTEVVFSVPYVPGMEANWTLEVHYLRSTFAATEANGAQLRTLLAEQGIDIDIFAPLDGSQTFRLVFGMAGPPDESLDLAAVLADAFAALSERIDGPWPFEFSLE